MGLVGMTGLEMVEVDNEFGLSSCLRRVKRMEMQGKPSTCELEQMGSSCRYL
jgi:hypothetical protein